MKGDDRQRRKRRRTYSSETRRNRSVPYSSPVWALLLLQPLAGCAQSVTDEDRFDQARSTAEITIVSLTQGLATSESRDPGCLAWKIQPDDVKSFFARSEMLTAEGMHSYDVYPCTYSGWLSVDGAEYEFGINAGGFGSIKSRQTDRVVFYGCKRGCERLFGELNEL